MESIQESIPIGRYRYRYRFRFRQYRYRYRGPAYPSEQSLLAALGPFSDPRGSKRVPVMKGSNPSKFARRGSMQKLLEEQMQLYVLGLQRAKLLRGFHSCVSTASRIILGVPFLDLVYGFRDLKCLYLAIQTEAIKHSRDYKEHSLQRNQD